MKKLFFIPLILVSVGWCSAARLIQARSASGNVYEMSRPQGVDYLLFVPQANDLELSMRSQQLADWYDISTHRMAGSGYTTFLNAESGHTYMVSAGGRREAFAVFDEEKFALTDCHLQVLPECDSTVINLEHFKVISYVDTAGKTQYVERTMVLSYNNAEWNEDAKSWETVPQEDTIHGSDLSSFGIGKLLIDTDFRLKDITFPDQEDSISTDSVVIAVAVAHHQQYYITQRGKRRENEVDGPYEDSNKTESAPLEVLFESHPSPKADYYSWTIKRHSDLIAVRNDKDIRYLFDDASESGPVQYLVELTVMNSTTMGDGSQCEVTATDTITLNSSLIFVPNVFTPNGDGKNDEFRVVYRSICEFHCWIYNRWQHLVYSWDDPAKGWDGTNNGKKLPDSAYIYIIDATGCDGQRYKLKGTVNMLRGE
ncbi:MAG: gliding motility-associated C-terminal domain-containing protein [Paludibacteraceae bacterium]|nr:gliding motility-associated C-terminal domain-containing protein [Paludibacteraceae bacterium]